MFSLAATLALLGLVALAIPVLIHLFNPGKGRLVWVGNIELVRLAKKKAVTEYRLTQWLLLLLRLFILVFITLLLAETFFHGSIGERKIVNLLTPQWVEQASDDQLQAVQPSEVLQADSLNNQSYWRLLSFLDKTRSSNETFAVYSTDGLEHFDQLLKPTFSRDIQWHLLKQADKPFADYRPVVAIYTDAAQEHHLKAALESIKTHRIPGLTVQWLSDQSVNYPAADWVFWLSKQPVPDELAEQVVADGWRQQVKQADFPNQLLVLMMEKEPVTTRFVQPSLSEAQIQTQTQAMTSTEQKTPLQPLLLMLLVLCWMAERLLAEKPGRVD